MIKCLSHCYLLPPYRREALYTWKQRNGSKATYGELIEVFERAGYKGYADEVRKIAELSDSEVDDSTGSGEEQPKTYPTLHKAQAFCHDQPPPATPKSAEVYVMVEEKNLPEGKIFHHASTEQKLSLWIPCMYVNRTSVKA